MDLLVAIVDNLFAAPELLQSRVFGHDRSVVTGHKTLNFCHSAILIHDYNHDYNSRIKVSRAYNSIIKVVFLRLMI